MIKCTDLRIGNYVLSGHMQIARIDGICEKDKEAFVFIQGKKLPLSGINPISIDPLILDACDFRHTSTSNTNHITYGFDTTTEQYEMYEDGDNYFSFSVTKSSRDGGLHMNCTNKSGIKYLHQLQNAFWWATGDELPFDFNVYAKFFV